MGEGHWLQERHPVRCEWGPYGAHHVAADAVVVVDVLSFTTSVSVVVERGAAVYPAASAARAAELAAEQDARLAVGRREVSDEHPWSLSPAGLRQAPVPDRLVLPSPNGSAIAAAASGLVVAASLRNAGAVARWLRQQGYGARRSLLVVPAGERWPDGSLRPAVEDLLGAGAVLAALGVAPEALSPEAAAALQAYAALAPSGLAQAVRSCASGQELVRSGFGADVEVAVKVDAGRVVPVLVDGCFRDLPRATPGSPSAPSAAVPP